MTGQHPPHQSEHERLQQARDLIKAKRYQEAAHLLKTVDHPTARDWLRKLEERLNAPAGAAGASSAVPTTGVPVYRRSVLQSTSFTCPVCRREAGIALVDCARRADGQCPYQVDKQENGSMLVFVIGFGWLALSVVRMLTGQVSQEDLAFEAVMLVVPLAITVAGVFIFLQSSRLRLHSAEHGSWTHSRTPFSAKTEIVHPLMYVNAPQHRPASDLPVSLLAWCLVNADEHARSDPVFSYYYSDGSIVYLTLVGLMLYGAVQLFAQHRVTLHGAAAQQKTHLDLYVTAGPARYPAGGALENALLAVLNAGGSRDAFVDIKTLVRGAAQRAGGEPHLLVERTVEAEARALGLEGRSTTLGKVATGTKLIFGDTSDQIKSAKDILRKLGPQRVPALASAELDAPMRALAAAYDDFEASHRELLSTLFAHINDVIESSRPDSSSN